MEALDTWDAKSLAERCHIISGSLGRSGVAIPPSPGNSEDLGAWIRHYAALTAALALADERKARRDADLKAAITAALDEQPERVTLSVPEREGTAWMVYPKSFHALQFLDTLDVALRELRLTALAVDAEPSEKPEDATLAAALEPLIRSQAVRVWAWILTHEGCGLPFDERESDVEPPEWTKELSPQDLLALFAAHVSVNQTRLTIIAHAFPPEQEAKSRLSLGGFMGSAAQELARPARELMRAWSLGAVFAQSVTASQANKEASEAARGRAA